MPLTGPAWLPSEFVELTSNRVLIAPVSQFFYASMLYQASVQAALRNDPSAFEWVPGRGVSAGNGAPVPGLETMQLMLADPIRSGAILVSDELATEPGSVIKMNRPVFSGGGYTISARTIGTGQSISTTPIALTGEQVPITILRLIGPMASGGSAPAPYGLDRFQAKRSVHSLVEKVGQHLQYDRNALLDAVLGLMFDSPVSTNILFPNDPNNALSTDASAFTASTNGDRPFDLDCLLRMKAKLQTLNIPRFDDGMYRAVVNPAQEVQLQNDPAFRAYSKGDPSTNPLKVGYLKQIGSDLEVYVSNSNTIDTTTVSGVTINHATMFGKEVVGYVRDAEGCRIALSSDDNYGETAKAVWIAYEGLSVLDNRFLVTCHSN